MPQTYQYIFTAVVASVTAGLIMLVFNTFVARGLKRADEGQKQIIDRLQKLEMHIEMIHKEFAAVQIETIREFATKEELMDMKRNDTNAREQLWREINPIRERIRGLEVSAGIKGA
jgi:hypothetical protein